MNVRASHHLFLAVLGLVAIVLAGCGGNEDLAKSLGCSSDSIMANADDTVVIRTKEPQGLSFFVGPTMGGISMTATQYTMPYSTYGGPIEIQVQAPGGGYRNDICIVLNTDGFFWDMDYTVIQGSSSVGFSRYVTKTDASGVATVWWSTGLVVSSATVSGSSPGADVTYADTISASSGGATQAYWNAGYTVKGCPVGVTCP